MEFKLQEVKSVPVVFNYNELKQELGITLKQYSNYVVDEKNLPVAKSDMAKLNKVKKALNDKKIEVKKIILQDYELFESQVKELIKMVDDGVSSIKKQTDAFEEERIIKKKQDISDLYNSIQTYDIPLNKIYNSKWENKGYDLKTIETEIKDFVKSIDTDLDTLKSYPCIETERTFLKAIYFDTLNLNETIKKFSDYQKQKDTLGNEKQVNNTITLDTPQTSQEHAKTSVKMYSSVFKFTDNVENMRKLKKFLDDTGISYEILENMKEVK